MTDPFADLPKRHYGAILTDPPWAFKAWSGKGTARAADNHYRTMSVDETLEPMLPLDLAQPARGRLSERIYEAVVALRRQGHTVWSIGRDAHKVDGKVASTKQLLLMARLEAEVAS